MAAPIIEWANPDKARAKELFSTVAMRAIIRGFIDHGRGTIFVDSADDPKVGWWSFNIMNAVAGDSDSEAARHIVKEFPYMRLLNVPDKGWEDLVKSSWGEDIFALPRTSLSSDTLDIEHIRKLKARLPEGFTLQKVDNESLENLADPTMGFHIQQFFGTIEEFLKHGFGFCIKHEGKVVSMASTFTPYSDVIEIEIDTLDSPEYRRKGLATVAGAALIEYALENGLVPNWDAQTPISVKLAEKLGYSNPQPYEAFIRCKPEDLPKLQAVFG